MGLNKLYFYKHIKAVHLLLTVALFLISFVTYINVEKINNLSGGFFYFRLLRSISSLVFLIVILMFQKRKISDFLFAFIFLYSVSSFLTLWYENEFLATLSMGLNSLSFVSLVLYVFPKIKDIKIDFFVISSFILIVLILSYLGFQFAFSFKELTLSRVHYFFIVSNVFLIVIINFLGIIYNHKLSSKISLLFLGFVFALLFAEVFRGIAYYNIAYGYISVLIARGLLIISIAMFSGYALLNSYENKELTR